MADNKAGPSSAVAPSPTQDFGGFLQQTTRILDTVTTHAAALPERSDLSFHRTLDRRLAKDLDGASGKILAMTERLLGLVEKKNTVAGKAKLRRRLEDEEDVIDGYRRGIVGVVDGLLEDADSCLDDVNGQKKKAAIAVKSSLAAQAGVKVPGPLSVASTSKFPAVPSMFGVEASKLLRPQFKFPDPVDNSPNSTWTPDLPFKHHAMVPIGADVKMEITPSSDPSTAALQIRLETERLRHPYYYENRNLAYPTSMFISSPPIVPAPLLSAMPEWVDTPESLAAMVEELKQAKEIAVDLEHHSTYSYYGFTCLMQISTREKDWLIDTIKLRGALREDKLGGVLADPEIIKVFHGAESDIVWLQKDFGIYVVNLFDTYHATVILNMEQHSLAGLLHRYCGFDADKRYQLADWRIRPLTPEMSRYAQADTHFLLYVYDNLRNALLEKSRPPSPDPESALSEPSPNTNPQRAMRRVLELSADTALRIYSKEVYDNENGTGSLGWLKPLKTAIKGDQDLNAVDTKAGWIYKRLHAWRDRFAREKDISPFFVLSNERLKNFATRPPTGLQSIRNGLPPTQLAIERVDEILHIVTTAQNDWNESQRKTRSSSSPPIVIGKVADHTRFEADLNDAANVESRSNTANQQVLTPEDFWADMVELKPKPSASSSLFGNTLPKTGVSTVSKSLSTIRKSNSTLFGGSASSKSQQSTSEKQAKELEFDSIVKSVNTSFQPPTRPTAGDGSATLDVPVQGEEGEKGILPEPETVPFVPVEQRTTFATAPSQETQMAGSSKRKAKVADDEIVPVGKKAKKKNKAKQDKESVRQIGERDAVERLEEHAVAREQAPRISPAVTSPASPSGSTNSVSKKDKKKAKKGKKIDPKEIPSFSYDTEKNLLDNPPPAPSKKKSKKDKKQKREKTTVSGTTFGSVPKDESQPKQGNKSITFA